MHFLKDFFIKKVFKTCIQKSFKNNKQRKIRLVIVCDIALRKLYTKGIFSERPSSLKRFPVTGYILVVECLTMLAPLQPT